MPASNAKTSNTTNPLERELTLTRVFDAPRELVFQAWTDPAHLKQWWGPQGFTTPACEVDLRVGGAWKIVMRFPDGSNDRQSRRLSRDLPPDGWPSRISHSTRTVIVCWRAHNRHLREPGRQDQAHFANAHDRLGVLRWPDARRNGTRLVAKPGPPRRKAREPHYVRSRDRRHSCL